MTRDRFEHVASLFRAACARDADERAAFLDEACGDDAALRDEVEALLALDAAPHPALAEEAVQAGAQRRASALLSEQPFSTPRATPPGIPPRIGEYEILGVLGSGGMGTVYRARQDTPARVVALKVLREGAISARLLRRFEYEAHILAHLQHPGIAQVFAAGTADDGEGCRPYLAMELLDGRSITDHADARRLDTRARIDLIIDVCDAVRHAHQKGIIHRDLKPANIMVTEAGTVKILDFGIARATDADLGLTTIETVDGQLMGTLSYMSPEQIEADPERIDTRCDVYAIGVILHELLAGGPPHAIAGLPIYEAARVIRETVPPRLGTIDGAYRGDVETIVSRALDRDRARRYQSAGELRADLARMLAGEPIEARRDSTLYVLSTNLRRHRIPVAIAATFMLVVTIAAVWLGAMYRRAEGSRIGAETAAGIVARLAAPELEGATNTFAPNLADPEQLAIVTRYLDEGHDIQPLVAADLRMLIGLNHLEAGGYDAACRHLRLALDLRSEMLEPPHADIAESLHNLGRALFHTSRFTEAEASYGEALEMRRAVLAPDDPDLLNSMSDLAACRRRLGRPGEAEALFEEVLAGRRTLLGEDDPWVAATINHIGLCRRDRGRYEEAERLLRDALDRLVAAGEGRPLYVARAKRSVATCRLGVGDVDAARALLAEALALVLEASPDHPDVARCEYELARCDAREGRYETAAAACRTVLAVQTQHYRRPHAHIADTETLLAEVLAADGEPDEAARFLETARRDRVALFGAGHPDVVAIDEMRATVLGSNTVSRENAE